MILFNLLTLNGQYAREATKLLLLERLATDVFVNDATANYRLSADGTVETKPLFRISFLTKALLCRQIEELLHEKFPENDFRVYTTAVPHVNDAEAERIRALRPV